MSDVTRDECDMVGGEFSRGECRVDNDDRFEGSFNTLRMGRVRDDPAGVMVVEGTDRPFATDKVSKSKLDSAVSRAKGVSMGDLSDHLIDKSPRVSVFTVEDGVVEKDQYRPYKIVAWSEPGLTGKEFK